MVVAATQRWKMNDCKDMEVTRPRFLSAAFLNMCRYIMIMRMSPVKMGRRHDLKAVTPHMRRAKSMLIYQLLRVGIGGGLGLF